MNYMAWEVVVPRGGCTLSTIRNVDTQQRIDMARGRTGALAGTFPTDAELHMNPDFPKDVKLFDQISSFDDFLVCSPKLSAFLQTLELPQVEALPVTIVDHEGKVASKDYSIIYPYSVQDCIDREASKLEWNVIDPELISAVFKLVLDQSKIDPAIPVFRPAHFARAVFVREDIAEQISAQGLKGPDMTPLDDDWAR